jgi:hypothetical protein
MQNVHCTRRKKVDTCDAKYCVWDDGKCKYIKQQAPTVAAAPNPKVSLPRWQDVKEACYAQRTKATLSTVFKRLVKDGKMKRLPPKKASMAAQCEALTDVLFSEYQLASPALCNTRKTTKSALQKLAKQIGFQLRPSLKKEDMCNMVQQAVWDKIITNPQPINLNASSAPLITTSKRKPTSKIRVVSKAYSTLNLNRIDYANRMKKALGVVGFNKCALVTSAVPKKPSSDIKSFIRVKRIGTDSAHGEVHLVANYNEDPALFAALKVMPAEDGHDQDIVSRSEIAHYLDLNSMTLEGESPHFPLVYNVETCTKCRYENKIIDKKHSPDCFILFVELAIGDLKSWLTGTATRTNDEVLSLQAQMLMGMATMHSKNRFHHDLHWGNWLYHEKPVGGYWEYVLRDGAKVFIKNTGQQWILWDFGMMEDLTDVVRQENFPMQWITQAMFDDVNRSTHIGVWLANEYKNNAQSEFFFKTYKQLTSIVSTYRDKIYTQLVLRNFALEILKKVAKTSSDVILINPAKRPTHIINSAPYPIDGLMD